ncbi:MAG: DNA-processing protein DprA, partial [Kordiimonas sp.]
SDNNIVIGSGLARGIDTHAHIASLKGGTIACLAGGLDIVYPPENQKLYDQISEQGLLVTEMPIGTKPQARHFPRRNRIISGLSEGLLVVEAAYKSGSLITARCAEDQGREVVAVPGSPLDPRAQGTNRLIKDGAILTQSARDILDELQSMPLLRPPHVKTEVKPTVHTVPNSPPTTIKVENTQATIMSYLSPDPIHIDEIVRLSGRPTETVLGEFTALELSGKIIRHAGNKFSRNSSKNE